jgi:WD40 repeat protein
MNLLILPILSLTIAQPAPFKDAKVVHTLLWNSDVISAVAFIGNDKVAAANRRGDILIWNLPASGDKSPEPVRRLVGHTGSINRLLLSPDGKTLISASNDHTVKFWDALKSDGNPGMLVMNDGYVRAGVSEKVAKLPDPPPPIAVKVVEQKPIREFTGHKEWLWGLALSRDGKTLVTGDDSKTVILSDAQTGTELRRWQVNQWIRSLDISPDGKLVVTAEHLPHLSEKDAENGLRGWDAQTGAMKFDASKGLTGGVTTVRFSDDGKSLAFSVGSIDRDGPAGKVFLLNPTTGEKVREMTPPHLRGATDLAFHPDGKHLVACGRDRAVKIWRISDGTQVHEISLSLDKNKKSGPFTPTLHAISIAPDGKLLAVADADGRVQILSLGGN